MSVISSWQKVSFRNSQGCKIAGLLYTPPAPAEKIVVVCHGFTGSKEGGGRALEMAEEFGEQGWAALLFDFAGCGESEGSFEKLTLTGQIDDLTCALKWCTERGFGKIVTLGRSFGGSTVICQAARDQVLGRTRDQMAAGAVRAAGVCTWATPAALTKLFTSLSDDEGDLISLAGERGVVCLKKSFLEDLRQYDVAADAGRLSPRPLLLVHGTKDELVPPAEAETIYRAAGEPKQLALIDGADHQFTRHYRQVWRVVVEWLKSLPQFPIPDFREK